MIDTVANLLFRCPHRRLTRPITPVSRPGAPGGETYVVCLDCGKQFTYDWKQMRIGKAVSSNANAGVLSPDTPKAPRTRLKYALLGSALPLAVLLGKTLLARSRTRKDRGESPGEPPHGESAR
jgi:hypothetical protein